MNKFKVGDKVNAVACDLLSKQEAQRWQGVRIVKIDKKPGAWPYTVIGSAYYPGEEGAFTEDELTLA